MKRLLIIFIGLIGLAYGQTKNVAGFTAVTDSSTAAGKFFPTTAGDQRIPVDSIPIWFGVGSADVVVTDSNVINGTDTFKAAWNTSPKYTPRVTDKPFEYGVNWDGDSIVIYIDTQLVAGQPMYGPKLQAISGGWYHSNFVEHNAFNGNWQSGMAAFNPANFKSNNIILDSTEIRLSINAAGNIVQSQVQLNSTGIILTHGEGVGSTLAQVNSNGFVLPGLSLVEVPTGEEGAKVFCTDCGSGTELYYDGSKWKWINAEWATAARPTGIHLYGGQMGYNTTLNQLEYYNGTTWVQY